MKINSTYRLSISSTSIAFKMPGHQIFIGSTIALFCLWGLLKNRTILEVSKKGQRLVARLGETNASLLLKCLFLCGIVFGVLLAIDLIQPMQW